MRTNMPFTYCSIKKSFCFTAVLALVLIQHKAFAQQNFIEYNMQAIPQRIYANPAFRPTDTTMFIGIPILSSQYFNVGNSGFRYSDLIKVSADDSLHTDVNNMLSKLGKNNYISVDYQCDLLSFGIGIKKNYFTFNVTEKVDFHFGYTQEFMNFLWQGNGKSMGQTINIAPSIDFTHYREYGFGWSRKINDKLTIGGKLKYLYGMENVSTKNSTVTIYTDPNDFSLTAQSNVLINTSGVDNGSFDNFSLGHYLFKKKNNGAGIDLGGTYKYSDKITFSASLIDLGFIHWASQTTNYQSRNAGASFTYHGIDYSQFVNNDTLQFGNVLKKVGDSLAKILKIDTVHNSYTTMLSAKIYMGATYQLTEKSNAGILLFGQIYAHALHPAITLSYNLQVGKCLSASASYSIYNRSYTDIGLGAAVKLGAIQFYILSDNFVGDIFPQNAKNINLHFGFNLIWARKRDEVKAQI